MNQICACNYFHKYFLEKRIFPLIYPNLFTCLLPKKNKILTRWIFFTFQWNHCYFMWVLLDSNIKAMQRMFENEKQVLFLFSSLFHVIQIKMSTCWNFKHYTREIWFDMKFSGKKIHSYLKTTLYIHKIQRHEKFNLSCHKILSFFILFFIFQ